MSRNAQSLAKNPEKNSGGQGFVICFLANRCFTPCLAKPTEQHATSSLLFQPNISLHCNKSHELQDNEDVIWLITKRLDLQQSLRVASVLREKARLLLQESIPSVKFEAFVYERAPTRRSCNFLPRRIFKVVRRRASSGITRNLAYDTEQPAHFSITDFDSQTMYSFGNFRVGMQYFFAMKIPLPGLPCANNL